MDREYCKEIINLATWLDEKEAKLVILQRWVDHKRKTPLSEYKLDHLAKKERLSYATAHIQSKGKYPDLICKFTKPQLIAFHKKLLRLESNFKKQEDFLRHMIWMNVNEVKFS